MLNKKYYFTFFISLCIYFSIAQNPDRRYEPIVLAGDDVEAQFVNFLPSQIHAYAYNNNAWTKIPFQIDEKIELSLVHPYGNPIPSCVPGNTSTASSIQTIYYCDPSTNVGGDTNPRVDKLDELVFMYKDVGNKVDFASVSVPVAVNTAGLLQKTEIKIVDPLDNSIRYVYFFAVSNTISQTTDDYVSYSSNIYMNVDCDYRAESSLATTDDYSYGFQSAWEETQLSISGSNDLVDAHQFFVSPLLPCIRNEYEASADENAYLTNIEGDVRAIRSIMGANSGPYTQRTQLFYENKHVLVTDHRVHSMNIPIGGSTFYGGAYDVYDFSLAMASASCDYGPSSDVINGQGPVANIITTNPKHTIINTSQNFQIIFLYDLVTDMNQNEYEYFTYYDDRGNNTNYSCTGDGQAFGSIGVGLTFNQETCTDPSRNSCPNSSSLQLIRNNYYLPNLNFNQADILDLVNTKTLDVAIIPIGNGCNYNGIADNGESGVDCGGGSCPDCPICNDGIQNGDEQGVDCGGSFCTECNSCENGIQDGKEEDIDCGGPICPPCSDCNDGKLNGQETGIDCGGPDCLPCDAGMCNDGMQNGNETGVDCGGPDCPPCGNNETCNDGIQNGDETGVDCGGPECDPCNEGCEDGIQNGNETGVDCGGPDCPPCGNSGTCNDGIQNGQESDIDCGGPDCPPCASCTSGLVDFENFNSGWGNWIDGGDYCERVSIQGANWAVQIKTSEASSNCSYKFTEHYESFTIDFDYQTINYNSNFRIEIRRNGVWSIAQHIPPSNNRISHLHTQVFAHVNSGDMVRFVGTEPNKSDVILLDNIQIDGCSTTRQSNLSRSNSGSIAVYPNPSDGHFEVSSERSKSEIYFINVYSLSGTLVQSIDFGNQTSENNMRIDLSHLDSGTYILKISTNNDYVIKKLVIVK